MTPYTKEGQVTDSVGAIITLIVGIGVGVLVLIFVGTLGGSTYTLVEDDIEEIGANSALNDAFTADNTTTQYLAHHFIQEGTLTIDNGSNVALLGNFSIDYEEGSIKLLDATNAFITNGSTWEANYTWGAEGVRHSVKEGIASSFSALEETGNYMPIIVLAVAISLILMLVLGSMALRGGNLGGSAL